MQNKTTDALFGTRHPADPRLRLFGSPSSQRQQQPQVNKHYNLPTRKPLKSTERSRPANNGNEPAETISSGNLFQALTMGTATTYKVIKGHRKLIFGKIHTISY